MTQFVLDCDYHNAPGAETACTLQPYVVPPATRDVYSFTPGVTYFVGAVVLVIFIVAAAMVRFRRQERLETEAKDKSNVELAKATAKHTSCPCCGTVYVVPEGKK